MNRCVLAFVVLFALSACAGSPSKNGVAFPPAPVAANPVPPASAAAEPVGDNGRMLASNESDSPPPERQSRPRSVDVPSVSVPQAKGAFVPQEGKARETTSEKPYQIQVENMPLNEFINLVFGKVLETSYTMDKSLETRKETVTLNMKVPVRQSEVLDIVREVFKSYGLEAEKKEGVFFVHPMSGQQAKTIIPYCVGTVPENVSPTDIIGLFMQTDYIKPTDFMGIAASLALSPQGKMQVVPGGMLSIIDDGNHVRAAAELIRAFDRPSLTSRKLKLFYLEHLPIDTFMDYLTKSLPAQGVPVAKTMADPGIMLIPVRQIRAVLAVSPKAEWLPVIGYWQEQLDIRGVSEDEPSFYIFAPKNRRASDLAKLFGTGGTGSKSQEKRNAGFKQQEQSMNPEMPEAPADQKALRTRRRGALFEGPSFFVRRHRRRG